MLTAHVKDTINGSEIGVGLYISCPTGLIRDVTESSLGCDLNNVAYPYYCYQDGFTEYLYNSSLSSANYEFADKILYSILPNSIFDKIISNQVQVNDFLLPKFFHVNFTFIKLISC